MGGIRRFALIAAALALVGVAAWQYAGRWRPSPARYPVQGVDVSAADGAIAWNEVAAADADFAYIVATRGASERDPAFAANWDGSATAGLRRGAVHVWSLCRTGADQANAFNTTVPTDAGMLPAALAIDYDAHCAARPARDALIADVLRFARIVEAHTQKPILLQVSPAIERDYRLSAAVPRSIWATGSFLRPSYAARPWRMWRASAMRRVGGIAGPAHWDVAVP